MGCEYRRSFWEYVLQLIHHNLAESHIRKAILLMSDWEPAYPDRKYHVRSIVRDGISCLYVPSISLCMRSVALHRQNVRSVSACLRA